MHVLARIKNHGTFTSLSEKIGYSKTESVEELNLEAFEDRSFTHWVLGYALTAFKLNFSFDQSRKD